MDLALLDISELRRDELPLATAFQVGVGEMHMAVYLLRFPGVILDNKSVRYSRISKDAYVMTCLVDLKYAALRRVLAVVAFYSCTFVGLAEHLAVGTCE